MEQIEGVEIYHTDEDLIEKIKIDGMALKYGNKNQRKNLQIASIAVKQNEKALIYVAPEIQEEVLSGLKKIEIIIVKEHGK